VTFAAWPLQAKRAGRLRLQPRLLTLLACLCVVKVLGGALSPTYGLEASYLGKPDARTQVVERSTEFRLGGPPPGMPGTVLFDEAQLREVVVDGVGWELAAPLELSISEETLSTEIEWRSLFEDFDDPPSPTLRQHIRARLPGPLHWEPQHPPAPRHVPTPFPHVVLRNDDLLWTSVHLALVKPRR